MADRLVSVDGNYVFPEPLESRLDGKVKTSIDAATRGSSTKPIRLTGSEDAPALPSGRYEIIQTSVATALEMPTPTSYGELNVLNSGATGFHVWTTTSTTDPQSWYRAKSSNAWSPWMRVDARIPGTIANPASLNGSKPLNALSNGRYRVTATSVVQSLGLPTPSSLGFLDVELNESNGFQVWTTISPTDPQIWYRAWASNAWSAWVRMDGSKALTEAKTYADGKVAATLTAAVAHADKVAEAATSRASVAESRAKTYADDKDTALRADAYSYTDTAFTASGPGGATDSQIDAAVERGVQRGSVLGPGTLALLAANPGGTDDTTALQAVLNAAFTSAFTRKVVGRAGVYVVSGITVPAGVTLADIRIFHKAKSSGSAVTLAGDYARVDNVEIDGNAVNQTNNVSGIGASGNFTTISGCRINDVKWDGVVHVSTQGSSVNNTRVLRTGRYGITFTSNAAQAPSRHGIVRSCYVEESNDGGIGIIGVGEDMSFTANTTRNTGGDGLTGYSDSNKRIVIANNTIYSPNNNGAHFAGTDIVITGNTAYDVTNNAWFLKAATAGVACSGGVISNNTATTVGRTVVRIEGGTRIVVTGNIATDVPVEHGIILQDVVGFTVTGNDIGNLTLGRAVNMVRASKGTIAGNRFHDVGGQVIYGRDYGTTPACRYITVTGNIIENAPIGIASAEASDYWVVDNNIFVGVTGAKVSLAGTNNAIGTNLGA